MRKISLLLAVLLALFALPAHGQVQFTQGNSPVSRPGGTFYATAYGTWSGRILSGNTATGSTSIIVTIPGALQDSTIWGPQILFNTLNLNPILVNDNNAETVTPTAISIAPCPAGNIGVGGAGNNCATITGTFNNLHGQSAIVASGSFGLAEAQSAALSIGGGTVVIDQAWSQAGGTDAMVYALTPYPNVSVEDLRTGATQYWTVTPATTTALAAPTALTAAAACVAAGAQFCSDANVAGSASWGGATYGCFTLVDIMGNESPCSSTINFTSVASKAIDMGPPAAVTSNVVGWKPYVSLSGGSYAFAYSMPLLKQPTVLQAVPITAGVCTLTTLETVTPACAIGNTTYGQSASTTGAGTLFAGGAQFTIYPLVTNTLAPEIGSVSATEYNANEEAHATYKYTPGGRIGVPGEQSTHFVFPITAAAQTAVGEVEATIPLPANFMNFVGKTVEVCGVIAKTSTTADTVDTIQLWWDAEGSNVTAGTPVEISSINVTNTLAAAANMHFCQQLTTTVAAATATGGTITPGVGYMTEAQVSAGAAPVGAPTALVAGVGSLNLALPAHISVLLTHTTGTDGAGSKVYGATLRVIN